MSSGRWRRDATRRFISTTSQLRQHTEPGSSRPPTSKLNIPLHKLDSSNHYEVLGVTVDAPFSQIKGNFYLLSKRYHPDQNKGSETAREDFERLSDAYSVLADRARRNAFDRDLRVRAPTVHHTATPPARHHSPNANDRWNRNSKIHPEDYHLFYKRARERGERPGGARRPYDPYGWMGGHYDAAARWRLDAHRAERWRADHARAVAGQHFRREREGRQWSDSGVDTSEWGRGMRGVREPSPQILYTNSAVAALGTMCACMASGAMMIAYIL